MICPPPRLGHDGENSVDQAHCSEHIGIELGQGVAEGILLRRAALGIARVVDQQIDPSGTLKNRLDP
jgi:hypothetical protein